MDTDELIDKLNTLQAQNIALMHMLAAVVKATSADVLGEYTARCAIFEAVTEKNEDADALAIQRKTFKQIGRVICGECDALPPE